MDFRSMLSVFMIISLTTYCTGSSPRGWKYSDRFVGFRFSVEVSDQHVADHDLVSKVMSTITDEADRNACFGWVQYKRPFVVGEARCDIKRGNILLNWLEVDLVGAFVDVFGKTVTKVYEDTKISYHFSSFRILDATKHTCFPEPPHACEVRVESSSIGDTTGGSSRDEL